VNTDREGWSFGSRVMIDIRLVARGIEVEILPQSSSWRMTPMPPSAWPCSLALLAPSMNSR
jgi:hypothetical protein